MESREELKKAILANETGYIEVRSYHGRSTHKRRAVPKYDPATRWYKGVLKLSEEDKKTTREAFVDPDDVENPLGRVELEHMKQFDFTNKNDKLIINWLVECDNIVALSYEEGLNNPFQTFYIFNKETDTANRTSKLEMKDTAIAELRKLNQDTLAQISRLMGYRMDKAAPDEIRLFIRELFEDKDKGYKSAEKFLEVVHDKNKDVKLFAHKAVDKGIVKKTDKGQYLFGEIFLGSSFHQYVSSLLDSNKQDIALAIKEELGESTATKSKSTGRGGPKTN
jgi:hypothetical protein